MICVVGAAVSIVNDLVATGPTLPAASKARTPKVLAPAG
jgi:hypothetical protein